MKKNILLLIAIGLLLSCEAIFVEDISNDSVTILAPKEKTAVPKGSINFNWNLINDAEVYHLQIATPTFTSASQIVLDTIISKRFYTKNLEIGNYQWRIKAKNSEYETDYTTTSFEVN